MLHIYISSFTLIIHILFAQVKTFKIPHLSYRMTFCTLIYIYPFSNFILFHSFHRAKKQKNFIYCIISTAPFETASRSSDWHIRSPSPPSISITFQSFFSLVRLSLPSTGFLATLPYLLLNLQLHLLHPRAMKTLSLFILSILQGNFLFLA